MSFVTVCGRLGRDADLRQGDEPSKSVVNFSVAEDVGYGDRKRTQWWSCALWGKRAEAIAQYLTKGTPVTVVGNPELRTFDKKDGSQGSELTIRVIDVTMQGRGQERDADQTAASNGAAKAPASRVAALNKSGNNGDPAFDDSDLPF
jgi:single-strand DNA-binding protein